MPGLLERRKTEKMAEFNWTPKRRAAREYLIQARGNVRAAAELSKRGPVSVSYNYLNDLKYSEKYKPFREEYRRRTGELLNALEVNTEYIIERYVELTRPDIPPSTRRQALRDLGQYAGVWTPKSKEAREPKTMMERIAKAIEEETDPERKQALAQAAELFADVLE